MATSAATATATASTPNQAASQPLSSAACLRRHPTPVLTANDIPYPATLVFNAGVAKWQGRYLMVFRNDVGPGGPAERTKLTHTNLGLAESSDGLTWKVRPQPLPLPGAEAFGLEEGDLRRVYDPRLHVIEGKLVLCCAVDTNHGVIGAILRTEDFSRFEVLTTTLPDNRNLVLFPQKIAGVYVRLDRPFPVYSRGRDRFDIWCSRSPDWRYWGDHRLVMGVEHVPYANDKIGPAAPPVLTEKGWLTVIHAVDRDDTRGKNGWEATWKKRYTAGLVLLDRDEPWKVIGMSKAPLIAPEASFETDDGFRNDGAVLEDSGEYRIWYGAADTVVGHASADVNDLLALCTSPR
jgi:beta-1,4-mannooligosaccharide/beta-1,4-mannosyl-N-acetylglucosamine phosphorylase